ncbi:uncharacterized protein LOC116265740 isoform X2 [Nymphaea colorata]|uniref:uncharacterized protein LOC116265740 isoform X2 n=1 Tax=Nymphaea colorata TaxID=210225 RepID=UPI00129DE171|nr:uncharacterized protein LOC116265740 isoform X2 [Nymphaea colorata]
MAAELLSYGNHQLSSIAWLRKFQASSRARLPVTQRLSCGRFGVPRRHLRAQLWENADNVWNAEESYSNLQVQTLRNFPKEQLHGKVVLVRFDSRILLNESQASNFPTDKACFTINYLHRAGAKVILTSSWDHNEGSRILSDESAADYLSELLQLRVTAASCICGGIHLQMDGQGSGDILLIQNLKNHKEEFANCSTFARRLSMGVDIFVNDTLSQSHRILASTVGVARFTYASIAGFHFEEELSVLMKAMKPPHRPYIAVIGGGNLSEKKKALQYLISRCDVLVFIGRMAFQFMHALGMPVPPNLVESGSIKDATMLIRFAQERNVYIMVPEDFLCTKVSSPNTFSVISSNCSLNGWKPVDIGPKTLQKLSSLLLKGKTVFRIGPANFDLSQKVINGELSLNSLLSRIGHDGCCAIMVGAAACRGISNAINSQSVHYMFDGASVMWELLKGRNLPGVAALDKAYPLAADWGNIFPNPTLPLFVDIGSGNGLFLFRMSRSRKNKNFLGLEINKKLVSQCLDTVNLSSSKNLHFINTNATTTFRFIVSRYKGMLSCVSIQCPNPEHHSIPHRWKVLQRPLVEAVADLLPLGAKVFLQSDIEQVASKMKDQFILYSKGRLAVHCDEIGVDVDSDGWLKENPFGIRSDWEQHVIDRGGSMYRIMLSKVIE